MLSYIIQFGSGRKQYQINRCLHVELLEEVSEIEDFGVYRNMGTS